MFTADQKTMLVKKLNPQHVKKNPQGFDYVEGWWVIAEANRIFGFDGWNIDQLELTKIWEGDSAAKLPWECHYMGQVTISISVDGNPTAVRRGVGYGLGYGKNPGGAAEVAIKAAATDALKRTLITFGWPFGLALYDESGEYVGKTEKPAELNQTVAEGLASILKGLQALQKDFGEVGKARGQATLEEHGIDLSRVLEEEDWPHAYLVPLETAAQKKPDILPVILTTLRAAFKQLQQEASIAARR